MATTIDPLCAGHRNVLLVEGQDDLHVVLQLYAKIFGRALTPDAFCIRDMKGEANLLAEMNGEILSPNRDIVGIIIDADRTDESDQSGDAVNSRWAEITSELGQIGIVVPQTERTNGVVIPGKPDGVSRLPEIGVPPRIGIWVMPDNEHPGELEDFIETMIPLDAKARLLAKEYIGRVLDEISLDNDRGRLREGKRLRGEIHAWLATRRQPRHLGAAIEADYLNTDGELCQRFAAWLRRLFGDPNA